ncbi:MAG: hypothetical protein ACRBCT_00300 [Alphaproteobacteria bacterium]
MSDKVQFLEIIKGKSVEEIYALPDLEAHLEALSGQMDMLDDATRANVEAVLQKLLQNVDGNIAGFKSEMRDGLQKIQRVQKNSEACIAYLKGQKK